MSYPSNSEGVAQDQLVAFVERIERLEEEARAINDDKSEVYKEAKANGFDVKVMKRVVAERRMDRHERLEREAIFELYWNAVNGLAHARVENIEEFAASRAVEGLDASALDGKPAPSAGTGGEADRQPTPETPHDDGDIAEAVSGDGPSMGADIAAGEEQPVASPAPTRQWKYTDKPHPDCLDPSTCGGFSNLGLCGRCKDAAAMAQTA